MTGPASAPDWDAIARYLSGESNAAEAIVVRGWLDANPADRALVELLRQNQAAEPADIDVDAALARVHSRMAAPALTVSRGRSRAFLFTGLAAAAALVLAVTLRKSPHSESAPAASR